MKASLLFCLATLGFASAAPLIVPRQTDNYAGVLADLATIKAQTAVVSADVKQFEPNDLTTALKLLFDNTQLGNDVNQATNDANNSGDFGDRGSTKVAKAVLKLQKPIKNNLALLVSKQAAFEEGLFGISLDPIVLNSLQTLKSDTDALGAALIPKLSAQFQSVAPGIINSIDTEFNNAIVAFGGTAS